MYCYEKYHFASRAAIWLPFSLRLEIVKKEELEANGKTFIFQQNLTVYKTFAACFALLCRYVCV